MAKKNDNTSFWVSYGDLMTSLFFVMMILAVILIAATAQLRENVRLADERVRHAAATEEQVRKLKELEEATKDIDESYFRYDGVYKKFVLNIPVKFRAQSSDISDIPLAEREKLFQAGKVLHNFMEEKHNKLGIDFLLIVEGQASKDAYEYNRQLSYERALALYTYWEKRGLNFETGEAFKGSEVLVVGSGIYGKPRAERNVDNQRFLITLINKPGLIK